MFSVASAYWLNPPLILVLVPWTIAAILCSVSGWKAFGIFFGLSGVALLTMMFVVNRLPDLGGDWPRDEVFFWWALVVYAVPALAICSLIRGVAERIRERRPEAIEEFE